MNKIVFCRWIHPPIKPIGALIHINIPELHLMEMALPILFLPPLVAVPYTLKLISMNLQISTTIDMKIIMRGHPSKVTSGQIYRVSEKSVLRGMPGNIIEHLVHPTFPGEAFYPSSLYPFSNLFTLPAFPPLNQRITVQAELEPSWIILPSPARLKPLNDLFSSTRFGS